MECNAFGCRSSLTDICTEDDEQERILLKLYTGSLFLTQTFLVHFRVEGIAAIQQYAGLRIGYT